MAIGVFDGVHRGHQRILEKVKADARRHRRPAMVVTFEPHPSKVLHPKAKHSILMSLAHRLRLFERAGLDEALVVPFNRKFSRISREFFLSKFLLERLGMRSLSIGHDFCFGRGGTGDIPYLKEQAGPLAFHLSLVQPLKSRGQIVSSTRIRHFIENGHLAQASKMLGRPVSVYGDVVRGRGRGRRLGFPTANLNPHHETLPPSGVYAAQGYLQSPVGAHGRAPLRGVIHIGARPTFKEKDKSLEVHFFNFHKNIYGNELELYFVSRIRGIRRFKDSQSLIRAIQRDASKALKILS